MQIVQIIELTKWRIKWFCVTQGLKLVTKIELFHSRGQHPLICVTISACHYIYTEHTLAKGEKCITQRFNNIDKISIGRASLTGC